MKQLINFGKEPYIFDVTDEEFADYERRNASEIERRRIMREHDEAQALNNARRKGREEGMKMWQDELAAKDALIAEKAALIAKLEEMLENKTKREAR
jgi:flagellar biosynthesis/type III secretory pathway protein FliH